VPDIIDAPPRVESTSLFKYFKYNDRGDNVMLFIGTTAAILAGLLLPSISLVMGSIASNFGSDDPGSMTDNIASICRIVAAVAVLVFIFSYVLFAFWQHLAENISLNLRKIYLKALLSQEIAYFEQI
jgi:ATP-binding cassette subfamily B (MDR/TAP) protein 1